MRRIPCSRIVVQLHQQAAARQRRELGAFVRYCVHRLERDLGTSQRWIVTIVPEGPGFRSTVAVHDGAVVDRSSGSITRTSRGIDGVLATWDALCNLEQALRESRASRVRMMELAFDEGP